MADYTGSIGLDITEFEEGINELMTEIPALEAELKQLNAQMAIMERAGKAGGAEYQRMARVQKELNSVLNDSKKQLSAFNGVLGEVPKTGGSVFASISKLRTNIGLIFSGVALGGVIAFGKSLLNFGKETLDAANMASVLPERLQRIQAALSDKLSADDSSAALKTLNSLLREARAGSADAEEKLSQLGVTFEDIKSKSPDEVFLKIADYVKNAKDPVEALRAVTNAFGEDMATKLIPALEKGGDAIKDLGDKAMVASDAQIRASAAGEKALQRWSTAVKQNVLFAIGWWDKYFQKQFADAKALGESQAARVILPEGTPNPANYRSGGRRGKGYGPSNPTPAQPTSSGSARSAELQYLEAQSEIARKLIPDYEKQGQLLEAQRKSLEAKLSILDESRVLERQQLQLQISQNFEAQRSWQIARDLAKVQIDLNSARASQGRGYFEKQRADLEELIALSRQYRQAEAYGNKDLMSQILAERRAKVISMIQEQEAFQDGNRELQNQTKEIEAQSKGLITLAKTYETVDKYQTSILNAIRQQNYEAAGLLQKQKQLATQAAMASQARVTPRERINAREAARAERRDARRQERRENEAEAAYQRGARGKRIDELRDSRKARLAAGETQKDVMAKSGNQSIANIETAVNNIASELTK